MKGAVPNGHGAFYATAFCARRTVNKATPESNGVCEERVARLADGALWPLQGHEVECLGCGRATCLTYGVHGDSYLRGGRVEPDPEDPRNRGIETGDARRAALGACSR